MAQRNDDDDDDLIGYEGAERLTGIRRSTLASMVHRRQIPHYRVAARTVRFSPRELREWLAARAVPVVPVRIVPPAPRVLPRSRPPAGGGGGRGDDAA